jgi:hypothetical protein
MVSLSPEEMAARTYPLGKESTSTNRGFFEKGDPAGNSNQLSYYRTPGVKEAVLASTTLAGLGPDQRSRFGHFLIPTGFEPLLPEETTSPS